MPVRVHHVLPPVRDRAASVAKKRQQDDVLRQTTKLDGVVVRSVATVCHAGSTPVIGLVMKGCAALAGPKLMLVVIVARSRRSSSAKTEGRRSRVRIGRALSIVVSFATTAWTVVCTIVKDPAILKMRQHRIVPARSMWSLIAPVVRRH
jgi:hypothetical protein